MAVAGGDAFLGIVGVVLTTGCLGGIGWLWYRVLRRPTESDVRCGACGFSVKHVKTMECPDCGTDFREVGLKVKRSGQFIGLPVFLVAWTALLPIPALGLVYMLVTFGPNVFSALQTLNLRPIAPEAVYQEVQISASGASWGGRQVPLRNAHVTLRVDGQNDYHMLVDLRYQTYLALGGPMSESRYRGGRLTPDTMALWWEMCGLDMHTQEVKEQANELASIIKNARASGLDMTRQTLTYLEIAHKHNYTTKHRSALFGVVLGVVAALVWLGGVSVYVVVRRRRTGPERGIANTVGTLG